uniref:Lipid membrane protein n=1 Tax=Pithovirus LCPAC101 TaxID=2506586 RepID=A0A481Z2V3_9VIRU|nr:MAG: lipid membrane protein [Pithovirus LCPAC101]
MVSDSKNTVDSTVQDILNIMISTNQQCSAGIAQDIVVNVDANCDVNIRGLSSQQTIEYDAACLSRADVETSVDQKLQNLIDQKAKSLAAIGGGAASSENITKSLSIVASSIKESYNQVCSLKAGQKQTFNITCTPGNTLNINNFNISQNLKTTVACVLETEAVTEAVQDLKSQISQTAESSKKGTLPIAGLIVFFIIIIIIIIAVVYYSTGSSDNSNNDL